MKYVKQLAKGASRNTCPKSRIKQMNAINVLGAENKVPDVTVVILVASFVIDLIKPVFPLLTDIHKYTNKHTYMHVISIIYIYAYNIFIIVYIYIYIFYLYMYIPSVLLSLDWSRLASLIPARKNIIHVGNLSFPSYKINTLNYTGKANNFWVYILLSNKHLTQGGLDKKEINKSIFVTDILWTLLMTLNCEKLGHADTL